jgi:hypothetical protein
MSSPAGCPCIVDRLESVEVDKADGERRSRSCPDPVGELALKAAPVGQSGQIIGEGDGHRRLPRVFRRALFFGDGETRPDDLGEHAKVLAEHADDEACGYGHERREPERQVGPPHEERDDEWRGRGGDDDAGCVPERIETKRASGGGDPDGDQRQCEFDEAALRRGGRRHQGERKRQRRPEDAGALDLASGEVERHALHPGARLEPGDKPKCRDGDESRREKDPVEERTGSRGRAAERRRRQDDDGMDIGSEPRERAVLLAQQRRLEVRLRHSGRRGCAEGGETDRRDIAISHSHQSPPPAVTLPNGSASGAGET